jgi:hypothetical protein
MLYEEQFLIALVLTIPIETIVLFGLFKTVFKKEKTETRQIVFAGIFSSFATLPYLWFVLSPFVNAAYYLPIGEILVTAVEAVLISQILQLKIEKAVIASVACNVVSFLVGLALLL